MADPVPGITATPHEENLRYFDVVMAGPAQSAFEGACLTDARRLVQAGAVPAGRISDGPPKGALSDAHLPPQHWYVAALRRRQTRPHLPRHSQG